MVTTNTINDHIKALEALSLTLEQLINEYPAVDKDNVNMIDYTYDARQDLRNLMHNMRHINHVIDIQEVAALEAKLATDPDWLSQ